MQVVPVAGSPEGDEIWVSSATTAAVASGSSAIENIFKNEMKRGWIKSSGLVSGNIDVPAAYGLRIAIDEAIGDGINLTLTEGNNTLPSDIAQDIEDKLRTAAAVGGSGAKAGNLSYLNAQVRFINLKFEIESGTVTETFTGAGKSSVAVGAPTGGDTDVRALLGFDITQSSETLASRSITETSLASTYSSGDILEVSSTAGFSAGNTLKISDGTNSQNVIASGAGVADGLTAAQIKFVTQSGNSVGLQQSYAAGSAVLLLHEIDVADPVSAITTMDQLYRFAIDSMTNQIDFSV